MPVIVSTCSTGGMDVLDGLVRQLPVKIACNLKLNTCFGILLAHYGHRLAAVSQSYGTGSPATLLPKGDWQSTCVSYLRIIDRVGGTQLAAKHRCSADQGPGSSDSY